MRAPSVWINGSHYEDPKDKGQPRRKQESNFFITINPNKTPSNEDLPNATKAMQGMLAHISRDDILATYIKFGPKDDTYQKDKYVDVVHSIEWQANVETGDRLKRLHTHIWLTITHYSQVQINIQMLQHLARGAYNSSLEQMYPNIGFNHYLRIQELPYVHVKLLPQSDWTDVMRQYIHKAMTQSTQPTQEYV